MKKRKKKKPIKKGMTVAVADGDNRLLNVAQFVQLYFVVYVIVMYALLIVVFVDVHNLYLLVCTNIRHN